MGDQIVEETEAVTQAKHTASCDVPCSGPSAACGHLGAGSIGRGWRGSQAAWFPLQPERGVEGVCNDERVRRGALTSIRRHCTTHHGAHANVVEHHVVAAICCEQKREDGVNPLGQHESTCLARSRAYVVSLKSELGASYIGELSKPDWLKRGWGVNEKNVREVTAQRRAPPPLPRSVLPACQRKQKTRPRCIE
jgi:hypothetical protein